MEMEKRQVIEMLNANANASMQVSNNFCIKLLNCLDNNFKYDAYLKNGMLNRGELVEAIVKYALGVNNDKAQAKEIDLVMPRQKIEIKYSTRVSYASACTPKANKVLLITPKFIAMVKPNQLQTNASGRIKDNYNGKPMNSKIAKQLNEIFKGAF